MKNYLISTDLDGTLIDHHSYSFDAALPAIRQCESLGIPIVLNTSKTYQEAKTIQKKLDITSPIVVENGSALFFDKPSSNQEESSQIFGVPRSEVLEFIQEIRTLKSWNFEGFNDWSIEDIARNTGLSLADAEQANSKQFSEPFIWHESETSLAEFIQLAHQQNLKVLKGGRFYHLQGDTDKAKPLHWLLENYSDVFASTKQNLNSKPALICLGDNHNDVAMLNVADIPVCVKSPVAEYPVLSTKQDITLTEGYGPIGWNEAVLSILNT